MKKQTYHWCKSCRASVSGGKGHNYTENHKQNTIKLMSREFEKIKFLKHFLSNPAPIDTLNPPKNYWCFCCEIDVDNSQNQFVGFQTIKHLQSNQHKKKLDEFWGECGVYMVRDSIKPKKKYQIGSNQYKEFLVAMKQYRSEPEIPPLDAETIKEHQSMKSAVGVADPKLPRPTVRVTASAIGEGITSISALPVINDEGNVHNGAVPPWLKNQDGSMRTITFKMRSKDSKFPKKLGADIDRDALRRNAGFLPNFGPIWQNGPRSEAQRLFREETKEKEFVVSQFSEEKETLIPIMKPPIPQKEFLNMFQ
eukprot:TRINITY_DN4063_c0_g1_i4.p1 TRINITY_DN4063_c0_g1~~TRINITY_DN4063_c0_g1_i4.p1  ORF type:complete len:309 (+),score=81.07 TRINITY_DN4063_c0_g1_i4:110-1036(+)